MGTVDRGAADLGDASLTETAVLFKKAIEHHSRVAEIIARLDAIERTQLELKASIRGLVAFINTRATTPNVPLPIALPSPLAIRHARKRRRPQ